MRDAVDSPAFGAADLTNCERELIHLAGSVQPHGALLAVRDGDLAVLQASANTGDILGISHDRLLGRSLDRLGGNVADRLRGLLDHHHVGPPQPFRGEVAPDGERRDVDVLAHRASDGSLIVELEPCGEVVAAPDDVSPLHKLLTRGVARISATSTLEGLADAAVQQLREVAGYDRVMFYKFDLDGHGEILGEARNPELPDSYLGLHYPASDIPQRARELYLRNRVRVLVDVDYTPVPIVPRRSPVTGDDLDMSLSYLRSMSPLHLQYLRNMGVTATLVASLVREGKLWGLIACHHYTPRHVPYALRAACELLAEVVSTRIAALETFAQSQSEVLVRGLEQRLLQATSTDGDWRLALFRNPRSLLQPLDATGAVLFYDGEVLTAGDVPSTSDLRELKSVIADSTVDGVFSTSSVVRTHPHLDSLTPTASGVLAIELSRASGDYLIWLRKEQLQTVRWAGDPSKPVVGNDPLELSPRRSFAVWSQQVQATARPWSTSELALAGAIGASLVDIILQIEAVRLLIAQHQLTRVRLAAERSQEPVIIADGAGRILLANEAFSRLFHRPHAHLLTLDDLAPLFAEPSQARTILSALKDGRRPWRGELVLAAGHGSATPVGLRADVVPGQHGAILGFVLIVTDLTKRKEADAARLRLKLTVGGIAHGRGSNGTSSHVPPRGHDELTGAIISNVNSAAMEIADALTPAAVATSLRDVEESMLRATALVDRLRAYSESGARATSAGVVGSERVVSSSSQNNRV